MYDDEDEVEEVVEVYEVPVEEEYVEDDFEEEDETPDPGVARGYADRAWVDEQAKAADTAKAAKRTKLATLKQTLLSEKSRLAKKEREAHDLDLEIKKDTYIETRERVAEAREQQVEESQERSRTEELAELEKESARRDRLTAYDGLTAEITALRTAIAARVREIALLEQELLRS